MTKKARYVEKLDTLSAEEKKVVTDFFTKYPNYEKFINWNSMALTYHDFEEVFSLAENSSRNIKRKRKANPGLLFESYNCEIIGQINDFLIVVPFDWECAVFFNSYNCGGEGARWCVGAEKNEAHWNSYVADRNIFLLVLFVNKHPDFGKKIMIQYHIENGRCTLWLQDNTALNKIPGFLNPVTKLVQDNEERILRKLCIKDYLMDGSTLIKCYSPETITIPAGVTAVGDRAFWGCENLSRITVEEKNPRFIVINGVLFDKIEGRLLCYPAKKQDTRYTIPADVTAIANDAFSYCENLETITIPADVTAIGDRTFMDCKRLVTLNIPDSVTSIGDGAFYLCENLANITIPTGVTIIGGGTFSLCESLTSITMPAGVTIIGGDAFSYCKKLETITIPASVTTIGDSAFYWCKNLTSITIPAGVTAIGDRAFFGCENLSRITVEEKNPRFIVINGVLFDKIENWLLCYPAKKQDTRYTIPADVTVIANDAFYGCKNLSVITVEENNIRFIAIDGVLFDKIEGRLLCYPAGKKDDSYTIPSGVTAIEYCAFAFCENLTSITIPTGVTSIENEAFYGCENLEVITIPASVSTIGNGAFAFCENLRAITIPAGVTSIGDSAFYDCKNLKIIYLSRKTKIAEYTFRCTPVELIYTD
jgi:hypothetical protein